MKSFACVFNAINGSGPAYLSELLHVYTHLVHYSSSDARMLKIQQYERILVAFAPFLALDPTFGIHYHKTDTAQPRHLLNPNWKPSSSHTSFDPTRISVPSFCYSNCVRVLVNACYTVNFENNLWTKGSRYCNNESTRPPHYRFMCACVSAYACIVWCACVFFVVVATYARCGKWWM